MQFFHFFEGKQELHRVCRHFTTVFLQHCQMYFFHFFEVEICRSELDWPGLAVWLLDRRRRRQFSAVCCWTATNADYKLQHSHTHRDASSLSSSALTTSVVTWSVVSTLSPRSPRQGCFSPPLRVVVVVVDVGGGGRRRVQPSLLQPAELLIINCSSTTRHNPASSSLSFLSSSSTSSLPLWSSWYHHFAMQIYSSWTCLL